MRSLVHAALALGLAGCLAAPSSVVEGPEPNDYRGLLARHLDGARRQGPFRLRANPVGCNCPLFEVEVGGRWLRAAVVEGERAVIEALAAALEVTPRAIFLVEGEVGRELLPCGRAALHVEFEAYIWKGLETASPAPAP